MDKYKLAEWMHDNYEQLAKAENWQTQEITRVKFEDLPSENKSTMLALADRMLNTFSIISLNPVLIVKCMEEYADQFKQPNVTKSVCQCTKDFDVNEVSRNPLVYKCTKCGQTVL